MNIKQALHLQPQTAVTVIADVALAAATVTVMKEERIIYVGEAEMRVVVDQL